MLTITRKNLIEGLEAELLNVKTYTKKGKRKQANKAAWSLFIKLEHYRELVRSCEGTQKDKDSFRWTINYLQDYLTDVNAYTANKANKRIEALITG